MEKRAVIIGRCPNDSGSRRFQGYRNRLLERTKAGQKIYITGKGRCT